MSDAELLDRFIARQDPSAFEGIVRRYGPLVLRVCRDVLSDPDDADDAFQATFLVLVRRADAIRDGDALGRWLYEVANRVALRARAETRRRQARERQGAAMWATSPESGDAEFRELGPVVHDELGRLPDRLRAPLVLCYFEGRTYEDAARRLRLPLGTLKGRLVRGREVLRSRLARRGMAVTALLLMALLEREARAVPPELVEMTVNSGALSADLAALPETIPHRVRRLVEVELRGRSLRSWATLGTLVLGLTAAAAGSLPLARPIIARSAYAKAGRMATVSPSLPGIPDDQKVVSSRSCGSSED